MLLKSYTIEIFRPGCNPQFKSLHCFAHLEEDISEVLPYLNTVMGGSGYTQNPPSLLLKIHGRLIALHSKKIAVNALKNIEEAEKILGWLKTEINETWEKRSELVPSYGVAPKPQPLEIIKLLPKTNCRECGQPTCMVFASLVTQGVKGAEDCSQIMPENKHKLELYLDKFVFDI